ncbi:hypothetical protein Q7P37_007495 [Cladosporium fusiforme]
MNADLSWGEVRWRDPQSNPTANETLMATPKIAHNRPFDMASLGDQGAWHLKPHVHTDNEIYAPMAKPGGYVQASQSLLNHAKTTTKSREFLEVTHDRSHTPQQSESTMPRKSEDTLAGSASGQTDQRLDTGYRLSEHPRALDIPSSAGPSGTLSDRNTLRGRDHVNSTEARASPKVQDNSLPSFASFQRSAIGTEGSTAVPQNVPSPERISCRGCTERDSSIEDIAIAVSGIEEILKMHQPESITKRPDGHRTNSSSTTRWVLDRLQEVRLKVGLLDPQPAANAGYGYRSHHPSEHQPSGPTRSITPPSSVKRQSDWTEADDVHLNKRRRHSPPTDQHLEFMKYLDNQRRASDSIQRHEPYRAYSPSHSDSWVSSVRPQQQSPGLIGASLRPLPSPSSLANSSFKTPWTGSVAPSGSSPTISHLAPSSIHTASMSSAASQHIADLQHQITVKSLGLQTLQSEYTSLLQKSQRDRLKSQTLEKKAVAADQEVNELTSKNEELTEQVKSLEAQAEQYEKKREAERLEASRQKDQWGKMLEMSGRLQAKSAEEKQKLSRERDELLQRVTIFENDAAINLRKSGSPPESRSPLHEHAGHTERSGGRSAEVDTLVASLQRDNELLQARVIKLRAALERVEIQYTGIMDRRRELLEQEAQVPAGIATVLNDDSIAPDSKKDRHQHFIWHDTPRQDARRHSADVSPSLQQRHVNVSEECVSTPSNFSKEPPLPSAVAPRSGASPHHDATRATEKASSTTDKDRSPPSLRAVPLPKWQPPNAAALRTGSELLATNQRRASGPSTPYPGSEVQAPQWHTVKPTNSSPPTTQGKPSSSSPQTLLPAFGVEKTTAPNYAPQHIPPPNFAGSNLEKTGSAASMPPPPRPGAPSASWRAS